MKRFFKHENENVPRSCIPQAFKNRLIQLASVNDASKLHIAFKYTTDPHRRHRELYNGVYITDSRYVLRFAAKKAWQCHPWLCFPWRWFQYDLDGPCTIYPIWQSVLHVDEIANQNEVLCVTDTLVLFLTSEESYDLIISKITGSYSRLVLHGYNYTWPQVKRLIHNKVKQVRIMDCVEVYPEEYDDVVKFMLCFSRSFVNK
uniref:DUF3841 domain-containing protein n=1 Tax=Panagrellus redivivus TaxID=6233 RepID=A0A7E4VLT3_PANRE